MGGRARGGRQSLQKELTRAADSQAIAAGGTLVTAIHVVPDERQMKRICFYASDEGNNIPVEVTLVIVRGAVPVVGDRDLESKVFATGIFEGTNPWHFNQVTTVRLLKDDQVALVFENLSPSGTAQISCGHFYLYREL